MTPFYVHIKTAEEFLATAEKILGSDSAYWQIVCEECIKLAKQQIVIAKIYKVCYENKDFKSY